MNLAEQYIEKQIAVLTKDKHIPDFRPGDTIIVHNKIIDEGNERIQLFEGVCLGRSKSRLGSTFKVKKISGGMCFEKTFPLYSPLVTKIEVIRRGKVKRAKLYYMRELVGKAARIKEKRDLSNKPSKA
ncbi:50S ribosomal protein L19 [Candidatus Bandiella euplotis]|uniref:Large ribosomal subunit protein bL19 n=1 Tax=Candidatus Bandiella euplotis TaxID=1664265 RepID=A0ABZ0UKZ3_9RICK|nr:50S ribosomal protein L19 [Candidatus Bandiella woodruffii]WPX96818.1 50S ribosomal protein L19 [Candidatus Bandiella woodruffii]